ncbi:MAG: CRTAC1 family protein [Acidobacteria bacterium]|nr:CRTAC1 family protein [Acidobacteriota bacterium]
MRVRFVVIGAGLLACGWAPGGGCSRTPPRTPVQFADATWDSGIRFLHAGGSPRSPYLPDVKGSGAAWGDYDDDGDLDLYLPNQSGPFHPKGPASGPGNVLYRNNGKGVFTDVSREAGVDYSGYSKSASWADYDGDGDLDLYVANIGPNVLYRNNGDGTFRDVTAQAGVSGGSEDWSTSCAWGDYDGDGDLVLYVCNYVNVFRPPRKSAGFHHDHSQVPELRLPQSYDPQRNWLYRNEGNGTFTEVGQQLGVDNPQGRSLAATFCDFNRDGWLDLYVGNDVSENVLFWNRGGTFQDVSRSSGTNALRGAMGLAVGDYNNDGDLDLFVTNWFQQENALYENLWSRLHALVFADVADLMGLGDISGPLVGWGTDFMDYDNDGWQDLLVVNGHTFEDPSRPGQLFPQRFLLFHNERGQLFRDVTREGGAVLQRPVVGRGAAFADYDRDGDLDVFVVVHFGEGLLLRNEGGNRGRWLAVRLRGKPPNTRALGARVEVEAGGLRQTRQVGTGTSYLSQNGLDAFFGLGNARQVREISVRWPDGSRTQQTNIAPNQVLTIEQ